MRGRNGKLAALSAALVVAAWGSLTALGETPKAGVKHSADGRAKGPSSVSQRQGVRAGKSRSAAARALAAKRTIQKQPVLVTAGGPVNDDCANAMAVGNGATAFNTTGASTDGAADALCDFFGSDQIGQDIWFLYEATCDGTLTVSLCGSVYDTRLAIYDGADCGGAIVTCNDDFCGVQSQGTAQVTTGSSYLIRVGAYLEATGSGTMNISCSGGGGGGDDDCENATPISDGATPFSNAGATTDGPADSLCDFFGDNQVNQDIWFDYTASCSGNLTVSLCGSTYDTKVALYDGTSCVGDILACNDDFCGLQSQLSAQVTEGNSYKLRVGGYDVATGSGTITISCGGGGGGGNDDCAEATEVTDGVTAFNTFGATTDGPADSLCDFFGNSQVNQDIWFNYTASCDGILTASLCGSTYDTKIAIYQSWDCVGSIEACNDDSCGLQSVATAQVSLGSQYKIRVGGFGAATGSGNLTLTCSEPSQNDLCDDAEEITDGTYNFSTVGATTDGDPSPLCLNFGTDQVGQDIWYNYTATCSQTLTVSLCGSFYDTRLAIYDGAGCTGEILACNDDFCGLQSQSFVPVTEGNVYKIRVGGFDAATGTGTMTVSCGAGPCDAASGDCCSAHPSPGCDDPECCTTVCACDPFCCSTEWDEFCSTTGFVEGCGAQLLCENQPCFIPPPENNECIEALPIADGATDYANTGTTNDGPELPGECDEGFGTDFGSDVWFTYIASCTGTVTFSTCDSVSYDSRLALYDGCSCPVTNDQIVACNDDGAGCADFTSIMEAFVTAGNCYLLRVGGYAGAQGAGTINISCDPVNEACLNGQGDCLQPQPSPGCSDVLCCDRICDEDAFCCDVEWDAACADIANLLCTTPANDECEDAPIETLPHTYEGSNVNADPDCGLFSPPPDQVWIAFVLETDSSVTLDYCGTSPAFGNAWLNLALDCPCSGFTDAAAFDVSSCGDGNVTMTWQCLPAGEYYYPVLTEAGSEGLYTINVTASECIDPCAGATGDCYAPHPSPGCEESACCNLVCDADPFCCLTEWDELCVDGANGLCGGVEPPANDLCANSIDVSEGVVAFTTIGAGSDGPALPGECDEGFGLSFTNDVWYDYTPSVSGDVTISLCDGALYDSRISLYSGCGCPQSNANFVGCNDDGCGDPGTPSTLTAAVSGGQCYKLRIGGFGGATGEGTFEISLSGVDCPAGAIAAANPPAGVVDARQTGNPAGGPLQGIASVTLTGPAGAPAGCFGFCETNNGGLGANSITNVAEGPAGTYTLTLARAITPGAVSRVTYLGPGGGGVSYTSHPANANGDSAANPVDILRLIDYLNGVLTPPWGLFSTDIDHSGAANPADILRLIDLLNGAGSLDPWNNTTLPSNPGTCP